MIARILAIAFAAFLGATTSQLPEFVQQYRQRLGGAIDELKTIVADFDSGARRHGLTREEAIDRLEATAEPLASDSGRRMRVTVERLDRLSAQRRAFVEAGPLVRIAVFARELDAPLARATAGDFEPAVPLTAEGAVATGTGFLAGLGLWGIGARLARAARRRRPLSPPTGA